jgi:hypothetical protein
MTTGFEGQNEALCNAFGTPGIQNDAWYAWTPCETGTATLRTCGQTAVDTKVAVYDGYGCPNGAALACNDDTCGFQSEIQWPVVAGATYTIQLGQYPGAIYGMGTFQITLEGTGGVVSICHPGVDGIRTCPCSNPPSSTGRGCNNSSATAAVLARAGTRALADTPSRRRARATDGVQRPPAGKQARRQDLRSGRAVRERSPEVVYARSARGGSTASERATERPRARPSWPRDPPGTPVRLLLIRSCSRVPVGEHVQRRRLSTTWTP